MTAIAKDVKALLASKRVLIIDDEHYSRKVLRALLTTLGVTDIHEATDGASGIDAILTTTPDIVLVDWTMPGLDGPGFLRRVRAPDTFPLPNVPIIMITAHGEKSKVMEAMRLGIHEFLLKPVSGQALAARLISVLTQPRPMVRQGNFYGPMPRKNATFKPEVDPVYGDVVVLG